MQPLIFPNQTLTIDPAHLALGIVRYVPEMPATLGFERIDPTPAIPAHWSINLTYDPPRNRPYALNGHEVTIERVRVTIPLSVTPDEVRAALPDDYGGVLFASTQGDFVPRNEIRTALLTLAATKLATPAAE